MCDINPMFHMDSDYMWRWFVTDAHGNLVCVSARWFFACEEARRNYDEAHPLFIASAVN
jgi:hypothetical protein